MQKRYPFLFAWAIVLSITLAALPCLAATKSTKPAQKIYLKPGLDALLKQTPPRAQIGVMVQTIHGQVLYQHNAQDLFTPASVSKLFVAISALDYLKPNYRFETRLITNGSLFHDTLNGDLYVQFTGDPALTTRQLAQLMETLKTIGIKKINGHVYIDNSAYGSVSYAPGWLLHDLMYTFAAPLNAVILNENRFSLILSPSKKNGSHAHVSSTVPAGVIQVDNHTITRQSRRGCPLSVYSDKENVYHLDGCVLSKSNKQYIALALRDPVKLAQALIARDLKKNQITFQGSITIKKAPTKHRILSIHRSQTLNLIVKEILKDSDNLFTNSLLKQIGHVYYKTQGTWQNGLMAMKEILGVPAGIDFEQAHLFDGAGLSEYSEVSPKQLANLLRYAYFKTTIKPDLWAALPIAGKDGTLRGRLVSFSKGQPIRAKTGTMSGVSALAGYLQSKHHGLLVFSIITNGPKDTRRSYKYMEDRICKVLLQAY